MEIIFKKIPSMDYISIKQLSEKWGISTQRIQNLCRDERIPSTTRIANTWAVPADAHEPKATRMKNMKYIKSIVVEREHENKDKIYY